MTHFQNNSCIILQTTLLQYAHKEERDDTCTSKKLENSVLYYESHTQFKCLCILSTGSLESP